MGGQQHIEIFIFVHNIILLPEIPPVIVARLEVLDANLFSTMKLLTVLQMRRTVREYVKLFASMQVETC